MSCNEYYFAYFLIILKCVFQVSGVKLENLKVLNVQLIKDKIKSNIFNSKSWLVKWCITISHICQTILESSGYLC